MTKVWLGTLLLAASLFSQTNGFHLTESKRDVVLKMGAPKTVARVAQGLEAWLYEAEEMGEGDYSHHLLFNSAGLLTGVVRNFPEPRNVDAYFPAGCAEALEIGSGIHARACRIGPDIWVVAMGSAKAGEPVGQLLLIREVTWKILYPAVPLPELSKR